MGLSGKRIALLALVFAGMLALAAGAAGRVYHGPLFAELLAGAAVGSVGIGLLLVRRPQWIVAPVSVLAMLGYVAVTVWWSARAADVTGSFGSVLVDALRNGGPRLLTALIPVEAEPDTVLLPVVLVWVAGLVTAELAMRGRRVPLALLPPAVVYLAALILAGPGGGVEPWRALAFVALAGTALALATPRAPAADPLGPNLPARQRAPLRSALRLRAAAGLVLFVAVAALVVPAVALGLPNHPADPRSAVSPPQSDTLDEDPLARISGWMQNPTVPLLDTDLSGPARLRLAVLSDFDGVTWKIGASYRDAGRQLPAPVLPTGEPAGIDGPRISAQIKVRELTGRLVPAVDAPREVNGIRVAYDQGSGTLLREDGLVAGSEYSVVSQQPQINPNLLPTADVPSGPAVARFLGTGSNVPTEVANLAQAIEEGSGTAYQKAYALQQFLAEHYTYVTDAPSGHAYPNLRFFLLGTTAQGGRRGTSEQFAASYAVLGRLMGLPTRVVVGFTAKSGRTTVTGRDALAWPEVLFSGIGWVAFNPIPATGAKARPLEQDYHPSPTPPTPSNRPTTAVPKLPSGSASATPSPSAVAAAGAGVPPWVPWSAGGGLVGLLILAQIGVVVARYTRAGRRTRTGEPSHRVGGAWLEVLDALRLAGRRAPDHLTATEVAQWAARPTARLAKRGRSLPPIGGLAELANMVGFAPEMADDRDAALAGEQSRAYIRALRRGVSWWRRLCWPLHPGPLRWRYAPAPEQRPPTPPGNIRPATYRPG
jgi:transglutaminase-like putative cysteine protease